jgi:hypothetical protein
MLRRVILGGVGTVALFACHDIDTTRAPKARGTIGEEVYGIVCDRIAAQALPEDLTGESFRHVCHKDGSGTWADAVDEALLPPIRSDAKDRQGNPVPEDTLRANRERALGRIGALVRRRADLVAALDAAFPDTNVGVKDLRNPDPTKSCNGLGESKLGRELADMLGRVMDLYTDGTIPESTRSLATLMASFEADKEAREAPARLSRREGYRPVQTALGAARPVVAYPRLRDLANATLSLLSADSNPYDPKAPRDKDGKRIPVPGPGHDKLLALLDVAYHELRSVKADPPLPPLVVTQDAQTGRTILSRPRDNLEALQAVLFKEDPSFGSGNPRYIVRRDPRGFAAVARVNGQLPAPFVDKDMDGLPDIDPFGQFVSSSGSAPPSPFFARRTRSSAMPLGAPSAAA